MATRKHCVAITLRRPGRATAALEEIELGADDLVDDDLVEAGRVEASLAATCEPPPPITWRGTPRIGLGKETMQVLAPLMVKQLARPAAPPPRVPRSAGLLAAAAAVATVLLSASAALAFS